MSHTIQTFAQWAAKQESFGLDSEARQYDAWLVAPLGRSRDSDCLEGSNFAVALTMLGGESDTVSVLRFGHWAVGWTELIVADPRHADTLALIKRKLDNYPVLNEEHYSELEHVEADRVWRECYSNRDRLDYIHRHESDFEFRSLSDLMGCVRGKYFAGDPSELLY